MDSVEKIKFTFESCTGCELSAVLEKPRSKDVRAYALYISCFTCTKDLHAARRIAAALVKEGIAVMRFDFPGLGQSGGKFEESTFETNLKDIQSAINYLKYYFQSPKLIIGHSLGGAAALAAISYCNATCHDLRGIITIGSPAHPYHATQHFREHLNDIKRDGKKEVTLWGRTFMMTQEFVEALNYPVMDQVKNMNKPLLIFHSPVDETVSISNAAEIFQAAAHPKSFVSLGTADHLLSKKEDSHYVAQVISSWAHRFL